MKYNKYRLECMCSPIIWNYQFVVWNRINFLAIHTHVSNHFVDNHLMMFPKILLNYITGWMLLQLYKNVLDPFNLLAILNIMIFLVNTFMHFDKQRPVTSIRETSFRCSNFSLYEVTSLFHWRNKVNFKASFYH